MNDGVGGASIAAINLNKMLLKNSINSQVLVRDRYFSNNSHIVLIKLPSILSRLIHKIDSSLLKLYPRRKKFPWNVGIFGIPLSIIGINNGEKILINWIPGLISIFSLFRLSKQVAILHDAWIFTGGCHVPALCKNYINNCKACPQLSSKYPHSLASIMKRIKVYIINKSNLRLICPSMWLYNFGLESGINSKNLVYIPNIVNSEIFRCKNFEVINPTICIVGGHNFNDPAKGMHYLDQFLDVYKNYQIKTKVLIIGGGFNGAIKCLGDSGILIENIDSVTDPALMNHIYRTSKVLIHFSLLENLSNTLIESLLSGTPALSWNVGGNTEIVDYPGIINTVDLGDINSLAENVRKIMLMENSIYKNYSINLRRLLLQKFNNENTIKSYIEIMK